MKVAYVSVEVSTKGRVSLDPKPRRTITKRNLLVEVSEIRTCLARGPDMSGKGYWNPALAPDMSGVRT
jgi:hypothetical protein